MRLIITALFVAMSFIPYTMVVMFPAHAAAPSCSCKGGCKGGPGWRGPEGTCVSKAKLAQICGEPAGAPCVREAAARVCFGKPLSGHTQEGDIQAP